MKRTREEQRTANRERAQKRRKEGICTQGCGHSALPGMSLCEPCGEKNRAKMQTHRVKIGYKELYNRLKTEKLCVQCRTAPSENGNVHCEPCRIKNQNRIKLKKLNHV